jgi:outer membrane biosynthesis protein TonB
MATSADIGRSPVGLIGSAVLHAVIIGATLFTFAHKLDITDESAPVVPVDLVTIAEKTNLMTTVRERPRIEPKDEEPTPPEPQKAEAPPQQEQQQPEKLVAPPPSKPVEAPPPPAPPPEAVEPEPTPKPPPPTPQKPKPQPDTTAQEPLAKPAPPVTEKVKPKPERLKATAEPKKDTFDINNVIALLDKRTPAEKSAPNARVADKAVKGFGPQTAMTVELQDSLRSQIQQCWNPPVGAPHPEEMVVEFELFLNQNGSVAQPPQLSAESQGAVARDSYARAAAEAARRAIYTCAPYKLPADQYGQWRDITLTFDPRQMMGQ